MVDKVLFQTFIELKNLPSYSTSVSCFDEDLLFYFNWNERLNKRTLYILNTAGECYMDNKILYPDEPLTFTSIAVANDFDYEIILSKKTKGKSDLYNWRDNYYLCVYRFIPVGDEE